MSIKTIPLSMGKAASVVTHILKAGLVPMLYGAPGEGKSAVAAEIAENNNLCLIDLRLAGMEPVDLNGVIGFNETKTKGKYIPLDEIPLEGDPLPINPDTGKTYAGWLIMLDELTSAADDTKAASYKLILDKKVGQHKIHKRIWMMAAGNREDDGAIAGSLGTALGSRVVNLTVKADLNHWLSKFSGVIDPRIIAFLNYEKDSFNTFNPTSDEYTHACARTYWMLHKLIHNLPDLTGWSSMIAGTIGVTNARSFETFVTYFSKVVTIEQIEADPLGATVPNGEPGWLYALTGVLARGMNKNNAVACMQFIERMPLPYQVIALRSVIKRTPEVGTTPEVTNWCTKHADELFK